MYEYKCEECDKSFHRNCRLIVHKEKCKSKSRKTCSHCNKRFTKISNLKRHEHSCKNANIKTISSSDMDSDIECENNKTTMIPRSLTKTKKRYKKEDSSDEESTPSSSDEYYNYKEDEYHMKFMEDVWNGNEFDSELEIIVGDNGNPSSIIPTFEDLALNSVILKHASVISASHQDYKTCLIYNFPLPLELCSPHFEINELFVKLFESRKNY